MVEAKDILPQYWIGDELGRGARSIVYEVKRRDDGERLAAKFVAVREPADVGIVRHLENEYRILKLLHRRPGPADDLIVKPVELLKARRWFKTRAACHLMEFAPGKSLAQCREHSLGDTLKVFCQICVALEHIHSAGYVHADLKPHNIMVDDRGKVKLIDFGFTLPAGTQTTGLKGSWGYLAPEQAGGTLNDRTDVFNLGGAMYWALTGQNLPSIVPDGDTGIDAYVPRKIRLTPPANYDPDMPIDLSDTVVRCCHYKDHKRPSTEEVHAFLKDLLLRLRLSQ